jgi:Tol biopolymer transport system component
MSRTAYSGSLYWAVLYLPFACFAQADNVKDYALGCYEELGIDKDAMELAFQGNNRACYYGTPLTTKHNGIALDPTNLVPGHKNFLKTCDAPAWLPSEGSPSQCYNGTYIKTLSFTNYPNVQGALLCRHKTRDPGLDAGGQPTHDDFDDIAMILHNQKTGKTCWFQTRSGTTARLDGLHVPAPHLDTPPRGVPNALDFWLKPSETAGIECAQCHDNGPWMNSQWLYSQYRDLADGTGPYETVKYGAIFDSWPKTDDFVEIGRTGLEGADNALTQAERDMQRKLPECTSCHKLAASKSNGRAWHRSNSLDSDSNGTYFRWFAYSTGRATIPQSTATEHSPRLAGDYLFTHWMPPGAKRPLDADTYNKLYKTHLETLKTCMQTLRADRKAPCATTKLAMLNSAPAGTGAMVSATNVQTGQTYTSTAAPLDTANPPAPQMLAVGESIRLAWQADATFNACSIKATMPAGVLVSATTASGSSLIGSGANWQLPETPPVIGPLTEPGIYDFSIYCRDTYTGSLQFQVGTTGPRSVVQLVTSVRDTVQATAVHSNSLMQPSTTTNVQSAVSVELTWIAYNVRPGSCFLSGPGVTSNEEVGSQAITVPGPLDQTFTFQCTGANDGVMRSVSSTLHPVASGCSYSIAPATASLPAAGGTGNVTVTAAPACAWAAGGNPGWITITSGGSGSGNGTIGYSVQANTGSSRTGTLTIAGQTFTVTQAAQASVPLSATLSASAPPVVTPDPMSSLAGLIITISGGTAGQRMTANVAVYLNTNLAVVPDTALLMDASGATIAAGKTANAYTFLNVQLEQPGAGSTSVYTIKNMRADTTSIPIPGTGSAQVTAMVTITGAVPFPLNNPIQTVALVADSSRRRVAPIKIAYPTDREGNWEIFFTDGTTETNLTRNLASDNQPAWSPDGKQIAFVRQANNGTKEIWVMDEAGGNKKNLTQVPRGVNSWSPIWSPDGSMIAFLTDRDDQVFKQPDLYVMTSDGIGLKNLTNNPAIYADYDFNWSPDAKQIVFTSAPSVRNPNVVFFPDLFVVDVQTLATRNLTNQATNPALRGSMGYPAWSPDGRTIAFSGSFPGNMGRVFSEIWVMNAGGGGERKLTAQPFGTRTNYPIWSPTGGRIVFSSTNGPNGRTDLFVMNADGNGLKNITGGPGGPPSVYNRNPTWSPDGERIAFFGITQPRGRSQVDVYVVERDGQQATKLTSRHGSDGGVLIGFPVWGLRR